MDKSEFKREERYIVVNLKGLRPEYIYHTCANIFTDAKTRKVIEEVQLEFNLILGI